MALSLALAGITDKSLTLKLKIRINGKEANVLRMRKVQARLSLVPWRLVEVMSGTVNMPEDFDPKTIEYPLAMELIFPGGKIVFWQLEPCSVKKKSSADLWNIHYEPFGNTKKGTVILEYADRKIVELNGIIKDKIPTLGVSGDLSAYYEEKPDGSLDTIRFLNSDGPKIATATLIDGTVTKICYRIECLTDADENVVSSYRIARALKSQSQCKTDVPKEITLTEAAARTPAAQTAPKPPSITEALVFCVQREIEDEIDSKLRSLPSAGRVFRLYAEKHMTLKKMERKFKWSYKTLINRKSDIDCFLQRKYSLTLDDFLQADRSVFRAADRQLKEHRARYLSSRALAEQDSENPED